jgi:hypothetical protein
MKVRRSKSIPRKARTCLELKFQKFQGFKLARYQGSNSIDETLKTLKL